MESAAGGLWNPDRAGFVYIYKVKATNVFCSNCISFKFSKLGGKNRSHYQLLFSCPHRRLSEAEEVECLRGLDCGVNRELIVSEQIVTCTVSRDWIVE